MSTIENLIRQWCAQIEHYKHAADRLETAGKTGSESAQTQADAVVRRALETLDSTDARIAESEPVSIADAALLAAFAYRAHNENDWLLDEHVGQCPIEPTFAGHSPVLAKLVRHLSQISDSDIGEIAAHWCVPLDGRPPESTVTPAEQTAAHEALIRALYVSQCNQAWG